MSYKKGNKSSAIPYVGRNGLHNQAFSGPRSGRGVPASPGVPRSQTVASSRVNSPNANFTAYCNDRKVACLNGKEASWAMLKKRGDLLSDARVLALGPKFIVLYISELAMDCRIYHNEIEGLNAEWFEATKTLVLDISSAGNTVAQMQGIGRLERQQRNVADIATVVNPADGLLGTQERDTYDELIREVEEQLARKDLIKESTGPDDSYELSTGLDIEPAVLPLTLRVSSSIPVSLKATGGDDRPLDIGVKLYVSSYGT